MKNISVKDITGKGIYKNLDKIISQNVRLV